MSKRAFCASLFVAGALILSPVAANADDTIATTDTTTVSTEAQAPATEAQAAPADIPAEVLSEPAPDAAAAITVLEQTEPKAELPVDAAIPAPAPAPAPAEPMMQIQPVSAPDQQLKLSESDFVANTAVEPGVIISDPVADQAAIDAAAAEANALKEADAANNAVAVDGPVIQDSIDKAVADAAAGKTEETVTTTGGIKYCKQDSSGHFTIEVPSNSKGGAQPCESAPQPPVEEQCLDGKHRDELGGHCHHDEVPETPVTPVVPGIDVGVGVDVDVNPETNVDNDVTNNIENNNNNENNTEVKNVNNTTNNNFNEFVNHNVNNVNLDVAINNAIKLSLNQHMEQQQAATSFSTSNAVVKTESQAKTVPALQRYTKHIVQQAPVNPAPYVFQTPVPQKAQPCASASACVPSASNAPAPTQSCPCICICCGANGGNTTSGQVSMSIVDLLDRIDRAATAGYDRGFDNGKMSNPAPLPVNTQVSAPAGPDFGLIALGVFAGLVLLFLAYVAGARSRSTRA